MIFDAAASSMPAVSHGLPNDTSTQTRSSKTQLLPQPPRYRYTSKQPRLPQTPPPQPPKIRSTNNTSAHTLPPNAAASSPPNRTHPHPTRGQDTCPKSNQSGIPTPAPHLNPKFPTNRAGGGDAGVVTRDVDEHGHGHGHSRNGGIALGTRERGCGGGVKGVRKPSDETGAMAQG